jgi:hypothetical protein
VKGVTPAAALFHHAARAPEDPWLFRRVGWYWRWLSFRAAAEQVRAPAGLSGDPSASGLSFEAVLADLALQAAGQSVTVRDSGGTLALTASDLAQAAEAICRVLPERPGREILVLGGAPDQPATRALLSWATVAGAALLLEHDPGSVVGSAVWARPTLFAGAAEEIAGLRRAAERQEQGWLRRLRKQGPRRQPPRGRLHTVFSTDAPLPPEDEIFWRDRGVNVRFLPQCGIAWYISPRGDRDARADPDP